MDLVQAALDAVDPFAAVCRALRLDADGRTLQVVGGPTLDLDQVDRIVVVGGGKAVLAMARAVESILDPQRIHDGRVIAKEAPPPQRPEKIVVEQGAHPLPDDRSLQATQRMMGLLQGLGPADLVLALISGGGSSLMTLPVPDVGLDQLERLGQQLLAAGVPIHAINTVRKHLSRIKGGQLAAAAAPARTVALVLSDVVGSPLDVIASGPTAPDPTTFDDALEVLARHGLDQVPGPVMRWLSEGAAGKHAETPKPSDALFTRVHNQIIGSNALAAEAVLRRAAALGFNSLLLSTFVEGEAREVGRVHAALLREVCASARPLSRPACLVLGGETTVTLSDSPGRGGRNQELALAAALALQGLPEVMLVALATDGNDGPTDAGGALCDGTTVARARALGLDPHDHLRRNDAYPLFEALGDLLITGPTGTNVNDLTLLLAF